MIFAHVAGVPVEELALVLASTGGVGGWAAVRALIGGRRKRRARRVVEAKRPETRKRRLAAVLEELRGDPSA